MKLTEIMSSKIVTVAMDDSLATVKDIFDHVRFHHLLVVENDKLMGVLSERDLFKALSPKVDSVTATTKDLATLNKRVHQIMAHNPHCLTADARLIDAIELFHTHKITCIPVVDDTSKPIGIISWRDIIRLLYEIKHPEFKQ